jgi:hypothetical protein
MKFFCIALSLLVSYTVAAQNLITNPGFEDKLFCPTGFLYNSSSDPLCVGWGQATNGTPDYFNNCAGSGHNIPKNNCGYQRAYGGGNAYVGIYTYVSGMPSNPGYEYIMTGFPALQVGKKYVFTMHVSLADGCGYVTDGIGVFFTTYGSPDSSAYYTRLDVTPQIDFSNHGYLTDTNETWITLTDTITADSAYKYLMIGNFKDSASLLVQASGITPSVSYGTAASAYYFIDSVSLVKLPSTGIEDISNASVNLKVAPNPFYGTACFTFDNPNGTPYSLALYDIRGALVKKMDNIVTGSVNMDGDGLPSGCYYYQLRSANGIAANGAVVLK